MRFLVTVPYYIIFFLKHPFVTQPLTRSLAIELLDKVNNPDHSTYHDFDDDDPEVGAVLLTSIYNTYIYMYVHLKVNFLKFWVYVK